MFGMSLALTLVLELVTARIMGLKGIRYIWLLILVNVLTNPAAVLLCWLGAPQLPVEAAVVIGEWLVYRWFSKGEQWRIDHPFLLSAVCNGASWITGMLLQMTGG